MMAGSTFLALFYCSFYSSRPDILFSFGAMLQVCSAAVSQVALKQGLPMATVAGQKRPRPVPSAQDVVRAVHGFKWS